MTIHILVQIYRSLSWIRKFDWLYYSFLSADKTQLHAWLYTRQYTKQFFSTRYLTFFSLYAMKLR